MSSDDKKTCLLLSSRRMQTHSRCASLSISADNCSLPMLLSTASAAWVICRVLVPAVEVVQPDNLHQPQERKDERDKRRQVSENSAANAGMLFSFGFCA